MLPALPGVPLVFAGLLVAAWAGDFQQVTWITLVVLGLLTAISFVIDLVATAAGAKRVGATRLAVVGAAVGTLGGLFLGLAGSLAGLGLLRGRPPATRVRTNRPRGGGER